MKCLDIVKISKSMFSIHFEKTCWMYLFKFSMDQGRHESLNKSFIHC